MIENGNRYRCPRCSFHISFQDANAAIQQFLPFANESVKVFEKWRADRRKQGLTGVGECFDCGGPISPEKGCPACGLPPLKSSTSDPIPLQPAPVEVVIAHLNSQRKAIYIAGQRKRIYSSADFNTCCTDMIRWLAGVPLILREVRLRKDAMKYATFIWPTNYDDLVSYIEVD
jgi:hypothetical protein